MQIAAEIGTMARRGAKLPYDAEVEYLESNGNQFIDTGIRFSSEMSYSIVGTLLALNGGICGSRVSAYSENVGALINAKGIFSLDFGNYEKTRLQATISVPIDFDIYNSAARRTFNDISSSKVFTDAPFVSANTFHIFHVNNYTVTNDASMRLFWFKLNDGEIMDLIPVRFTNESGVSEGAMFDRVSVHLFRNAGTGAFTIGPDKVSQLGGGYNRRCVRRSHRRSSRPSARFCRHSQEWEVAA